MRAVHYLNQFFAGLGGEEAAGSPPTRIEGAVGPGKGLEQLGVPIAVTLACGDDEFGEHEDRALADLLRWLADERPDVLVCGPSFGSGRYGYACGLLAREAARLGIPAVCGMDPESPGVAAAEGAALVVPTSSNVAGMREALPAIASLAAPARSRRGARAAGRGGLPPARAPPQRACRRHRCSARGRDAPLEARGGDAHRGRCRFDHVTPPPPVADMAEAKLALVTEAGCVPQGNPDGLPTIRAAAWLRYPIGDAASLEQGRYESVHGGFDVTAANRDPNRLVPLDVVRAPSSRTAGSAPSTTPSTRRPATAPRWPCRRSSGRRSPRS